MILFSIFFHVHSHLDSKNGQGFSSTGYFCPQCKSKYCELPIECKACGEYVTVFLSILFSC